jgi:4a-hydroxytetrahydrobiopterin dehydratase
LTELAERRCVSCRSGDSPLTDEQIVELYPQVADWQLKEIEGVKRLERTFKFKDFAEALAFTNQVGELAERADHHPLLVTEWGRVIVQWWTHKVKGLHQNDFIMAARTDGLIQ